MILLLPVVNAGEWFNAGHYHEDFDDVSCSDFSGTTTSPYCIISQFEKYNTTNGKKIYHLKYDEEPQYPTYFNITSANMTSEQIINYTYMFYPNETNVNYGGAGMIGFNGSDSAYLSTWFKLDEDKIFLHYSDSITEHRFFEGLIATISSCVMSKGNWYSVEQLYYNRSDGDWDFNVTVWNEDRSSEICSGGVVVDNGTIRDADTFTWADKDGHGSGSDNYFIDEIDFIYASVLTENLDVVITSPVNGS